MAAIAATDCWGNPLGSLLTALIHPPTTPPKPAPTTILPAPYNQTELVRCITAHDCDLTSRIVKVEGYNISISQRSGKSGVHLSVQSADEVDALEMVERILAGNVSPLSGITSSPAVRDTASQSSAATAAQPSSAGTADAATSSLAYTASVNASSTTAAANDSHRAAADSPLVFFAGRSVFDLASNSSLSLAVIAVVFLYWLLSVYWASKQRAEVALNQAADSVMVAAQNAFLAACLSRNVQQASTISALNSTVDRLKAGIAAQRLTIAEWESLAGWQQVGLQAQQAETDKLKAKHRKLEAGVTGQRLTSDHWKVLAGWQEVSLNQQQSRISELESKVKGLETVIAAQHTATEEKTPPSETNTPSQIDRGLPASTPTGPKIQRPPTGPRAETPTPRSGLPYPTLSKYDPRNSPSSPPPNAASAPGHSRPPAGPKLPLTPYTGPGSNRTLWNPSYAQKERDAQKATQDKAADPRLP